jgi:hypothetical protein
MLRVPAAPSCTLAALWALNQVFGATAGQTFYGRWLPAGATSSVTVSGPYVIPAWSPARTEARG